MEEHEEADGAETKREAKEEEEEEEARERSEHHDLKMMTQVHRASRSSAGEEEEEEEKRSSSVFSLSSVVPRRVNRRFQSGRDDAPLPRRQRAVMTTETAAGFFSFRH